MSSLNTTKPVTCWVTIFCCFQYKMLHIAMKKDISKRSIIVIISVTLHDPISILNVLAKSLKAPPILQNSFLKAANIN